MHGPKVMQEHASAIGSVGADWMQTLIDSSHILIICISISVIIYASFKSLNIDWDNEQIQQNDNESVSNKDIESKDSVDDIDSQNSKTTAVNQQHTQDIGTTHALLIPLAASVSLLLMFFFFESIQMIFLLCTSGKKKFIVH